MISQNKGKPHHERSSYLSNPSKISIQKQKRGFLIKSIVLSSPAGDYFNAKMTSEIHHRTKNWSTGLLRFTAFTTEAIVEQPENLFLGFFGIVHEIETRNKTAFTCEFARITESSHLRVVIAGQKIDFIAQGMPTAGQEPGLPNLSDEIDFIKSAKDFLKIVSVKRLAFGGQYFLLTQSREDAYSEMSKLMHYVDLDSSNSSEFAYQINRPRKLTFEGKNISINRLSNWATVRLESHSISSGAQEIIKESNAVAITTDINTDASLDMSLFDFTIKEKIIDTLFEYTNELLTKGDIP